MEKPCDCSKREQILAPGGIPRWIRVYDNDGRSFDRYTVVFSGRYAKNQGHCIYLAMSGKPRHPQGFCIHGESLFPVDSPKGSRPPAIGRKCHLGRRIAFEALPVDCMKVVIEDYKDIWKIGKRE